MPRLTFAAAIAALSLASGAASAQSAQMIVRVGDLNLSTQQGAAVALQRIDTAAVQFCGGEPQREIGRLFEQHKCIARMTDMAVQKLDSVRVTQLHSPQSTIVVASGGAH